MGMRNPILLPFLTRAAAMAEPPPRPIFGPRPTPEHLLRHPQGTVALEMPVIMPTAAPHLLGPRLPAFPPPGAGA
eukprot:14660254-Heterocapsa_arctica.AAC.1